MERDPRLLLFIIGLGVLFILAIIYLIRGVNKNKKRIRQAKQQYDQAIQEGGRAKALQLGRLYYSMLRGGRLTIYDEQAITNDLSTINSTTENTRK